MKTKKRPAGLQSRQGCETERAPHENSNKHTTKWNACQTYKGLMRMDNEKPGFWAVLPAAVRYDMKLPPMARLLYAEISALTDRHGYCFATNEYFQKLYQITDRTLQAHLRALKAGGYIRIVNGDGGHGRRRIYAGINPLAENPEENFGVPANPEENFGVTPKKSSGVLEQEEITTPPKAPKGGVWDPEAFERFWRLYPKKRDKAKAIREWNRLKADRKLMGVMSAALRTQMASEEWQRDNGRAIPYPCRWLSHRRWEDELSIDTLPQKEAEDVWL